MSPIYLQLANALEFAGRLVDAMMLALVAYVLYRLVRSALKS